MTGAPECSPKVVLCGFMEKPGIEPATPGLQGIALIHYTTGASLCDVSIFVAVFLGCTSTGRVGLCFLWFYVQELPKAQLAVVLVLKRLRRRGNGLKSHPTDWEKPGIVMYLVFSFFQLHIYIYTETRLKNTRFQTTHNYLVFIFILQIKQYE